MGHDLPGKPAAGQRLLQGNGGFFFNVRRDDPGELAALRDLERDERREQLGQDRFECRERSQELSAHPRPLTGTERSALRAAAAPLLADLPPAAGACPRSGRKPITRRPKRRRARGFRAPAGPELVSPSGSLFRRQLR
jgi:hypothetical protein